MINDLLRNVDIVYLAYGSTDFRKQTYSLCNIVKNKFKMNPYNRAAYIFCNKKRNSIRVLCYDKNGFVLAQKTLLDVDKIKFQWPRDSSDMKRITKEQLNWLLSGLKINPGKHFQKIEIEDTKVAY